MKPFSGHGDTNIMNPNIKKTELNKPKKPLKKFKIREGSTIKELCENLGLKARDLIEKIESQGFSVSVKTEIYEDLKDTISKIINQNIEIISIEDEIRTRAESKPDELIIKAPDHKSTHSNHHGPCRPWKNNSSRLYPEIKSSEQRIRRNYSTYRCLPNQT